VDEGPFSGESWRRPQGEYYLLQLVTDAFSLADDVTHDLCGWANILTSVHD
jgi:hypothetical protein